MGDNERLYALVPRLRLKRHSPQAGLKPGTARDQQTSASPTELPVEKVYRLIVFLNA